MKMTNNQGISASFWRGISTVAAIIVGVIYISNHITDTINEAVRPLKDQVEAVKQDVEALKPKMALNEYRIGLHEQLFKEFVKPEEVKPKNYK